jgi:hypothetical protein
MIASNRDRIHGLHRPLAVLGTIVVLGTGACAGSDFSGGQEASSGPGSAADAVAPDEYSAEDAAASEVAAGEDSAADEVVGAPGLELAGTGIQASRQVILDGDLVVEVKDLDHALDSAEAAVLEVDGFLASERIDNSISTEPVATAIYRIPPSAFHDVIGRVGELGEVRSQQLGARDVGEEVTDLDSRLATLEASIDRLRGFLATTTDATQIATLETELTRREAEAASIAAQRRTIGDQIDFATISVEFHSPGAAAPVEPARKGFSLGLETGTEAASSLWRGALAAVGFSLPFIPLVAIVAVLALWIRRRHSRSGIAPDPAAIP